ncbi:MAG: nickel pincer cofactor biosynthesis protein LarC [Candidatus Hodarchaeales archaeon]|jgi:uncharacterized protein (TIGR00299 family) protein
MSIIIIDPRTSGASGDLLIAALLDIQTETFRIEFCNLFQSILAEYDPEFKINCSYVEKQGFRGTQIKTSATKKFLTKDMNEMIENLSQRLNLMSKSKEMAIKAFKYLTDAEKKVHNKNHHVQFHELATIDTVFDIVGFSYLWEKLGLLKAKINILPIAVGGGLIEIAHGKVSVPTPATIEIIRQGNLVVKGGPISRELLTPTGAAIIASLEAIPLKYLPLMNIKNNGRSFGTREYEKEILASLQIYQCSQPFSLQKEEINVIETNVDDVDGETIGYLFELLHDEKLVLDLTILNTISKKNRPGYLIQALVDPSKTSAVIDVLIKELGTLGVRILTGYRHVVPRKIISRRIKVMEEQETVNIKRGFLGSNLVSEKIEYEDLRRIARQKGDSLQKIKKQILSDIDKERETNA